MAFGRGWDFEVVGVGGGVAGAGVCAVFVLGEGLADLVWGYLLVVEVFRDAKELFLEEFLVFFGLGEYCCGLEFELVDSLPKLEVELF